MRRVVITGMGIWSCLGTNLEEVRHSLYHGISGIGIEPYPHGAFGRGRICLYGK